MSTTRRLVLMRHSKAEKHAPTDHARPLSARGRRDARAAGALLVNRDVIPDLVLVSTSQRTRDTWEAVCEGMGRAPEAWFDRALYDDGPKAVVELVAAVEDAVETVMVIGHNPTMSTVAAALSDGNSEPVLEQAVGEGLPTSGIAVFDVPVSWSDVNAGTLRLTAVETPRG